MWAREVWVCAHTRALDFVCVYMRSVIKSGRLDGLTKTKGGNMKTDAEVEVLKALIKNEMPDLYASIQLKAKSIGNEAFTWVRRGLQGEPNCFYGFENGRVVGTPFSIQCEHVDQQVRDMVAFGSTFCSLWGDWHQGGQHGTH